MVALLVIATFLILLTVDYIVQRRRARARALITELPPTPVTNTKLVYEPRTPMGVYFAPGHTWAFLEQTGAAKVGITDFAKYVVGAADAAEPLAAGKKIKAGDVLLRLKRGGRTATFRSPVTGTIEKVNTAGVKRQGIDRDDPYTSSWIYRIRPKETSDVPKTMMLGEVAVKWLRHELERIKVFLATTAPDSRILGQTLPDGGLIAPGLIESLNDADWDKFQEKFFG